MSVHVAIPCAPSGPERDRLHQWVIGRWKHQYVESRLGWTLCFATDRLRDAPATTDVFNHPAAINRAVGQGGPRDVLVIGDADTFPDPATLGARVDAARLGRWNCSARYVQLNPDVTRRVLDTDGFEAGTQLAEADSGHLWEGGMSWSGVVVIRRDQFEAVGGYDERFTGWAADDIAFAMSCLTLIGPVLRIGTVYHLHHDAPKSRTYDRPGFDESWQLTTRYMDAQHDPARMRALIGERNG